MIRTFVLIALGTAVFLTVISSAVSARRSECEAKTCPYPSTAQWIEHAGCLCVGGRPQ